MKFRRFAIKAVAIALGIGELIALGLVIGAKLGLKPVLDNTLSTGVILVFAGALLASLGAVAQRRYARQSEETSLRRAARAQRIALETKKLSANHPELLALLSIIQAENNALASAEQHAANRSFWSSAGQNFVFFVLGVAVPIVIERLHLL